MVTQMGKKTIDVQILLQWVMGERFVILTPVIVSMCQLMTDNCSYSSIIQRPELEGERWTLHKLKLSWYWQLPGYYTVHCICINILYRTVCNWTQSKLINGRKLKICCHFADFIHCFCSHYCSPAELWERCSPKLVGLLESILFWLKMVVLYLFFK